MMWKTLFVAACAAALAATPALAQDSTGGGIAPTIPGRAISVNFATGNDVTNNVSGDTLFGLDEIAVAGSQWDNITGSSATSQALKVSGATSGATLTFRAGATWSLDTSSATNALLASFLDDGTAITVGDDSSTYAAEITVAGIPFETYDVYLYSNVNNGTGFKPIQVNDQYYTYADGTTVTTKDTSAQWGATAQTTPQLGKNVLIVSGISDKTLTIRTLKRQASQSTDNIPRGSFAGFQIVERLPLTINVNVIGRSGNMSSIKDTAGVSGLIPVENANWSEFNPTDSSANSGTIENAIDCTGADTTAQFEIKMGGGWNLTEAGTEEARTERTQRLGAMGMGYADASESDGTTELTLKDVPYTEYSVILYLATDASTGKWAPAKVTVGETVKYYAYPSENASDAAAATDSDPGLWGTVSACYTAGQVGRYGQDTMLIEGLSGDVSIDLGTSRATVNGSTSFGGLSGFQIVCTGEVIVEEKIAPGVVSLNFGGDKRTVPTGTATYGLVSVAGDKWQNFSGASGTSVSVTTAENVDLASTPMTVTYSASGTWENEAATDPFMYGYLDDGDAISGVSDNVAVSVDVAGVGEAFDVYDVIVYLSTDLDTYTFFPVQVNGFYYRWDDTFKTTVATPDTSEAAAFGQGKQAATEYGVNAIRVTAQTGALALRTLPRLWDGSVGRSQRGCLAAIQVVERKVIEVNTADFDLAGALTAYAEGTPLLVKVASGATIAGDVTLPADTILDFSDYTFGETAPFTGTLTMTGGTIRLPKKFDSAKIAASISGSFTCFIGDELVWLSNQDGTLSLSYEWWGLGGDDRWSNPLNWSSGRVPSKNAEVSFNLGASDEIVILDEAATVASVTITGSESSAATLEIQAQEGGSLAVSGQMLTTGNVTVTQSANITVNGATEMYSIGAGYPEQPCQAGFHVHQGTWKILSGTLSMPTDKGANTGEAGISGGGTLIVGGEGASEATLAVRQLRPIYYNENPGLASGTLRVATGGTLTASYAVRLLAQNYTTELAGGTIKTPLLETFAGAKVSADSSFLRAPDGGKLAVEVSSGDALTGTGGVTLSGTVTIESALTGYTGTLTVSAGSALTLFNDARPSLVLEDNASLTVTPTDGEAGSGTIVFPTTMTMEPTNVTYTVNGLGEEEKKTFSVSINEGTLTLSWEADYPTLSTTGSWSTGTWTTSEGTTEAPSEGSATLDGTGEGGIEVTLDTDLSQMTSIFVKGNVTLVTKGTQSTTIPACVALAKGATLTVDANFSGAWELPAGTTLQVTKGFTSFAGLTLEGAVVILEGASGTDGTPTEIEALRPVEFNGGLTIAASSLTLKSVYNVGTTLALEGDNITIEGNSLFTDNGTRVVNTGTGNAITGVTGLNGSLAVEEGVKLALTLGASPTNTFSGATIAAGATLTLAAVPANPDVTSARNWLFPVTGDGTLVIVVGDYDFRPNFSAVSQEATTLPKHLVFTATEAEQAAGVISCGNNANSATLPEGLTVTVNPAEGGGAWVPNAVLEAGGNSYLKIYNVPVPNGLTGLDDEVTLTLRQAAAKAGITNGDYTVQLKTGGQTVDATAAALNDVLGCFTGLTATAEGTTLTYAYDFGISGVRRTADGWEVVVKVTGANGADAGFAAGNVYAINGEDVAAPEASAQAETDEVVLPVTEDQLKAGVSVSVARPEATL